MNMHSIAARLFGILTWLTSRKLIIISNQTDNSFCKIYDCQQMRTREEKNITINITKLYAMTCLCTHAQFNSSMWIPKSLLHLLREWFFLQRMNLIYSCKKKSEKVITSMNLLHLNVHTWTNARTQIAFFLLLGNLSSNHIYR